MNHRSCWIVCLFVIAGIVATFFFQRFSNPVQESIRELPEGEISEDVIKHLKEVRMDHPSRLDFHYRGGDIGEYLSQFHWGDKSIMLAQDEFEPFIRFFDSIRKAALEQDLSKHSRITNPEIRSIFWEAFPDENPFGMSDNFDFDVGHFYEVVDSYKKRKPANNE